MSPFPILCVCQHPLLCHAPSLIWSIGCCLVLFFVRFLLCLVTVGCCCSSALSGSGRTKKSWQKQCRLASVADNQLKALKLGFKHPKRNDRGQMKGEKLRNRDELVEKPEWIEVSLIALNDGAMCSARVSSSGGEVEDVCSLMCQDKYKQKERNGKLMNIKISLLCSSGGLSEMWTEVAAERLGVSVAVKYEEGERDMIARDR